MSNSVSQRKIAFYTSGVFYGGLEKNALHYIQWLQNDNCQVVLITDTDSVITAEARLKQTETFSLNMAENYFSLKKSKSLARLSRQIGIDVLFIIRPRDIITAFLTKIFFRRGLPTIFFQQSNIQLKNRPLLYSILFRPFNAWIVPFKSIQEKLIKHSRYNPAQMLVIPSCINAESFSNHPLDKLAAREQLNLPLHKTILGTLGKYDLFHRHDFLIRAIQLLKRHNHHFELLIMGRASDEIEEEYYEFLKELAVECNVEDRIFFRPYPEKSITLFRAIDVFLMNWPAEPYDMIAAKAMAANVNVIARFADFNTELLGNGNYGLLYRENDLQDLCTKIIHLTSQPKLSEHLRIAAYKNIMSTYDKSAGCNQIHKLLNKLGV